MKTSILNTGEICALPKKEVKARWGSLDAAKAKQACIVVEAPSNDGLPRFALVQLQGEHDNDGVVALSPAIMSTLGNPDKVTWRVA